MLSYEIIIECTTINLGHKSMEKGMVSVRSVLMGSVAGLSVGNTPFTLWKHSF